jgi:hypothetical protein
MKVICASGNFDRFMALLAPGPSLPKLKFLAYGGTKIGKQVMRL